MSSPPRRPDMPAPYDVAVVGGGIIGLATAQALLRRFPYARLVLLEKEPRLASHQTGHNSGVIHSGLYYRPGSLKAQTCVAGAKRLIEFCQAHHIPYRLCGKLVVATEESELPALARLRERGTANGVPGLRLIGPEQMREIEPHARGIQALHVPTAGIVDYGAVAHALANLIREAGGEVRTSTRVRRLVQQDRMWVVETTLGAIQARYLVTCAGLYADRLSGSAGHPPQLQIVPFRGEYYEVVPERRHLVKGMIYPVPNPALPFLGVHFTRTVDDRVHAGPNAVLAFKREGYRKHDVSLRDLAELVRFPGFWRMARTYWSVGLQEWFRALSKQAFVHALQRLVPEIQVADVSPGGSGVRAQAVDRLGSLLDDFQIIQEARAVHVQNVPSPAATASLQLGEMIARMVHKGSRAVS